jgi:Domain of unknown function (DUF6438)
MSVLQAQGKEAVVAMTLVAALTGCASGAVASSGRNPGLVALPDVPEALIQMRHGSCPSDRCPVYQVSIFMDGTFVYDGVTNVAEIGRRSGKLSPDRLNSLLSTIEEIGFLDRSEECCVCPTTDGSHLVVVEYHPGVAQKIVVHDERCRSAPVAIGALENSIARETAIDRWVTPAPEVAPTETATAAITNPQYSANQADAPQQSGANSESQP